MLRCWLTFSELILFASCGTSLAPPTYPQTVAGGYRLYRENVLAAERLPKEIPAAGLIRAVQLIYDASNGIQLTVLEMRGSADAFKVKRKWRAPDSSFHARQMGRYFVIAQGEKPDPDGIEAFLMDFGKQLE